MSSTSSLLTLPSVDEPLELTKTAPVLDPKIPFFKYLDLLTVISQNALSLRHQAYEIFLALNPHLSVSTSVPSISGSSGHNLNMRQQPVKVNKKIENFLKSSMILLQRYCLVIQVSLPKLPSFRRRTHGNSMKAYEVRAAGYLEDLRQYQEEGGLLYLQACFAKAKAAQRDLNIAVEVASQVSTESDGGAVSVPPDGAIVAKVPLNKFVHAPVKYIDQKVTEPSNNLVAAKAVTPPVVGVVKKPSKTKKTAKEQLDVPVILTKQPSKTKSQLSASVVALEQPWKAKEQLNGPTVIAESTSSSQISPSRRTSRRSGLRKISFPERQVEVELEVTSSTTYARLAEAEAESTSPPAPTPEPTLTSTALWKLERDLEKLNQVQAMMEEQITKSANIRARGSKLASAATLTPAAAVISQPSTTATVPSMATTLAIRLTATALSQFSDSTQLSDTSTPATINAGPSAIFIPPGATTFEQSKRAAETSIIVTPAVTLTVPTPPSAGSPSTSPKPLTTRATIAASYNPPRETAKSTNNKRMSPVTGAIRGSGVVRNLIRQYESPSSASSSSNQSDRPDLQLNRKKKPIAVAVVAAAAATSLTTPAGTPDAPRATAKGLKTGQTTFTTSTTAVIATPTAAVSSTMSKATATGMVPGSLLHPRKDASPDLGDKQDVALVSASGVKARHFQDFLTRNRDSVRTESNMNGSSSSKPFQFIVPPVVSTSTSSASYSLSKARSAITKSALILKAHQPTHIKGQLLREQSSKPRTAAEAVKDSYLLGAQAKANTESLQVPKQGHQSRTRTSLNGNKLWTSPLPPCSQTGNISSGSMETVTTTTSGATAFRIEADSKPAVALGNSTFVPSDPSQIMTRPTATAVCEVNLSRSSRPISTSSKAMSSDESIRSWRRDIPIAASASRLLPLDLRDDQISSSAGSITNQPIVVDWLNEADYEDNDGEDDRRSHIDLIRIPTTSSTRSNATASTTQTNPFSPSSPLGSRRFTPRHRPSLSSILAQETLEVQRPMGSVQVDKRESSVCAPDTDESETETASLQYLDVPPARGTQAWLEMRARDREQEREEAERRQLQEDGEAGSGPEHGNGESARLAQHVRHNSKYPTIRVAATGTLRPTSTSSRPQFSQVRFDVQGSSPSSPQRQGQETQEGKQELHERPMRSGTPYFTKPFKPDRHRPIQLPFFTSNAHQDDSQRLTRNYASTILSSSTCSVRQPAPSHSVSPASSAFASIRGTPAPSTMTAPSVQSFATGSTTTLRAPKFALPPSSSSASIVAPRSHYPTEGQTDDGKSETLSTRARKIRAQEASVLGSFNEPVLGSMARQMNVERAATIVRNGSEYYGQQQQRQPQPQPQQQQCQQQQRQHQQQHHQHDRKY